jgi:hypothetical protein
MVTADKLRQDRLLDEAVVFGGDPLHLAVLFGIAARTSLRYTDAVREVASAATPSAASPQTETGDDVRGPRNHR